MLHRCIQEGHENFTEAILRVSPSKVLNFSSFKDQSSANGLEHTPFVRQYALYLEERIVLYRDFALRVLSPKLTIQSVIPKDSKNAMVDLFKAIENLQRVMEELLMCCNKFKKTMLHNRSTIGAFTLLLFDSFGLYKMLSDGSLRLLGMLTIRLLIFFKTCILIWIQSRLNKGSNCTKSIASKASVWLVFTTWPKTLMASIII